MLTVDINSDLNFGSVESYIENTRNIALSSAKADVIIDFSNAGDVDSAAVAFCLRLLRQAQKVSGTVTLRSPSEKLVSLLDVCKLKGLFQIS